jgi:hypothetical protein
MSIETHEIEYKNIETPEYKFEVKEQLPNGDWIYRWQFVGMKIKQYAVWKEND